MPEIPMDDDTRFDPMVEALRRSAALLDADPAAVPDAGFRARARSELLQAMAAPPAVGGWAGLLDQIDAWRALTGRRRLVGFGIGAALFGLVAVPALAAPSLVAGVVSGAVGTVVAVPSLLTGTYQPIAHPVMLDRDDHPTTISVSGVDTTSTSSTSTTSSSTTSSSTSSTSTSTSATSTHPENHGATVSSVARSTDQQGEAHGDAVSAAAHANTTTSTTTSTTTTASTTTTTSTTTSATETGNHGAVVSAVAHETPPPGENHGQQVSSVARGITTTSTSSSSTATSSSTTATTTQHGHNGHGGGPPTSNGNGNGNGADSGANGKGHGH